MGFLRGLAVVFLAMLIFVSLVASNTLFVFGTSLKYDNVKAGLYPLVQELSGTGTGNILPQNITQNVNVNKYVQGALTYVNNYCQNNTDYTFKYNGYSINITCDQAKSALNSSNPAEAIINQSFDSIVSAFYYQNYNCTFTQCFSTINPPTFLVSQMSQQYFMGKFYLAIIVSVILIALLILAAARKANAVIIIGTLLIASGIFVLEFIKIAVSMLGQYSPLLRVFLTTANTTFLFSLIVGIVLILAGIGLRIWHKVEDEKKNAKERPKQKKQ